MTSTDPGAGTRLIDAGALLAFTRASLRGMGASDAAADEVADHLVDANLTGYDSHGVHLLPAYRTDIGNGELRPAADPRVEWQRPAAALVSGEWGFGHRASRLAMAVGIELARGSGVAVVGTIRMHHNGRVGAYVEQAARAGCAALAFVAGTGGAVQAAPYGGRRRQYGANPFGAGFPAADGDPLVVDYATTGIAGGKVMLARAAGASLPEGVLLDPDGNPSTDPEDLVRGGALLPFGGHKGYGLALTGELLARVLTGSDALDEPLVGGERFGRAGCTFVVIAADLFRAGAAEEAARTLAAIRQNPPVPGGEPVRTPGQREAACRAERLASGIPMPAGTAATLAEMARSLGVDAALIAPLAP